MKKNNLLMALMMVISLSFVACCFEPAWVKSNEPGTSNTPEPPKGLTFNVEIGEVTASTINYTVTPSDLDAEYLCVLYDVESADEFTKDEYLVTTLYQELEAEARTVGKTLVQYMPEVVDKGAIVDGMFSNLRPESEYYIILFGVDAANEYAANTKVFKTKVTTAAAPKLETTFEINTVVDGNSATYNVIPSNNDDVWYFYTLPKATYDAYTDPAGQYQMGEQEFLLYCLQMEINAYREAGYTDVQIMNAIFHKGALTLEAKGLNANSEYINMVAGFIVTPEGQVTIATDVTTSTYTTGDAKAADLTFQVTVTDIEAMRAAIKIVPSDNKQTYCWMCGQWDGSKTAEDVMNEIVTMWGGWMNNGAMLYSGVQDFTGGPGSMYKYSLDAPDTDYYVIAFGYAGGVTTEPNMVTFRTLPAPPAEDTTFTMSASNITPYSCDIALVASESTTYYIVDVCTPEQYNEEQLIKDVNDGFDYMLEMAREWDPSTSVSAVLKNYYYKGNQNISAEGLAPETTLMGYVFALSTETGHVVKTHVFENLATTKAVGSITPTVEIVGHYSGDEENGTIFGSADATKGKAITVVTYGNLDGARSLFTTMLGDDMTNVNTYSDSEVWRLAAAYWNSCSIAEPYTFYVAEWDVVQTAMAYAVDQTGTPGGVGRAYSCATVENKGNIQDLADLIAELKADDQKKSFHMPESVVIGKNTGLTLSFESVEAPVADVKADVKSVEAPVANAVTVKKVSYIRPFYL